MRELSGPSSEEEFLKGESPKDALFSERPPKDLFPDEILLDDLSFEFEDVFAGDLSFEDDLTRETLSQDLSSQNSSTGGDRPSKDASSEEGSVGDLPSKDISSQEDLESAKDPEPPDIGRTIAKSLRAAMQWCDAVANEPNDIITNFKSNLPFIVTICILIILLWILKFFYV